MSALTQERARRTVPMKYKQFTLTGAKAYRGGRAFLRTDGKVEPATAATARIAVGVFAETVDATSADAPVTVDLERELVLEYFANGSAGAAIATTDIGSYAYAIDDQTVGITPAGGSPVGRIWDIDSLGRVGVEKVYESPRRLMSQPAVASFTANNWAPATLEQDAVYQVPATAGVSTITLPAGEPDGRRVFFAADGTNNANTVQYVDATGSVNLTTALTASKRHLVVAVKVNGKWTANAYVSP